MQLAAAMRDQGLRFWSHNVVALVETGRQRADRLLDLAALCRVFAVPLRELIATEEQVQTDGGPTDPAEIMVALEGSPLSRHLRWAGMDHRPVEPPGEMKQYAARIGLTEAEFALILRRQFHAYGFRQELDSRAGVTDATSERAARALRGWAARALLQEISELIQQDGKEVLLARLAREERASIDVSNRQTLIDSMNVHSVEEAEAQGWDLNDEDRRLLAIKPFAEEDQ